jgi:predicted unusual protein kinase regulating ubiquinone biosynthesis (AarF/ABC1/UbiB family)
MLARSGTVRMPVVYGVMTHEEHPGPDVLLMERLRGVPVEAPARTPNAGNI